MTTFMPIIAVVAALSGVDLSKETKKARKQKSYNDPLRLGPKFQPSSLVSQIHSNSDSASRTAYLNRLATGMKRVKMVH